MIEKDGNRETGDLSFDGGRGIGYKEGRTGDWMQSYTGRRLYPADARPQDYDILDIAMSLATKTRYNGHCLPYSVAEHSVLVSKLAERLPVPSVHDQIEEHDLRTLRAKWGLMHDIAEYIIPDIARPVKRVLGKENDIFRLDEQITATGFLWLDLPPELPKEVLELDTAICIVEKEVLHPRGGEWNFAGLTRPNCVIQGLDFTMAGASFLRRYAQLWSKVDAPIDGDALVREWMEMVESDIDRLLAHIKNAPADAVRA